MFDRHTKRHIHARPASGAPQVLLKIDYCDNGLGLHANRKFLFNKYTVTHVANNELQFITC